MSHEANLIAHFDAQATGGAAEKRGETLAELGARVIDAMDVKAGQQLLDVGCGAGWATRILGKKAPGAQAVGIDVSPETIKKADETSDWTSRARFECSSIEAIDFPDGRFDHVLVLESIEYVEDPAAALASIARVTKSGGRLELVLRRLEGADASADEAMTPALQSGDAWAAAVGAAGFTVESSSDAGDGALWIRAVRG